MMVPTVIVWVAGPLTTMMLAALIAWLLTFIAPPFIIWIKQINTCRGTEFGTEGGVAAQVLALALAFEDSEAAIAGMVTTTNIIQSKQMRDWRIREKIYSRNRIFSRNAASKKRRARSATLDVILPHTVGAALKRRTASTTRRPSTPSTATELLQYLWICSWSTVCCSTQGPASAT